jgi:hypothetical protein
MRRAAAVAVALACGAALIAACGRDPLAPGEARLVVDGRVDLANAPGPFRVVHGTRLLRRGDRIRVVQGSARVEQSGGRSVEMRQRSLATFEDRLVVSTGEALLKASGTPLDVGAGSTEIALASGAARLSAQLAVRAASYVGGLDVMSAGRGLHVPELRQAVVAAPGLVPDHASPITYDATDSWDHHYLGDAIEFGGELTSRSRGFTAQLRPDQGHDAAFFRPLLPDLATQPFDDGMVDPQRAPGETLVGAAIVLESRQGGFGERWASVFGFRDAGADWGIVAADQHVARDAVLRDLDAALGRAATPFTGPAPLLSLDSSRPPSLPLSPLPPPPPASSTATTARPSVRRPRPPSTTTTTLTRLTVPTITIPKPR